MSRGMRWGAAALASLVLAFASGRWSAPAPPPRVEERVKVEWRERLVERQVAGPVRVVTKTVERLAACPASGEPVPTREVVTTEERGAVVIERVGEGAGVQELARVVTPRELPRWLVAGSYGTRLTGALTPGALVLWRPGGPLWVGASATLAGEVRGFAGFSF